MNALNYSSALVIWDPAVLSTLCVFCDQVSLPASGPLPGGVQLHPSMLDDALFAVPDVLDYRASLEGEGDRLRLALQVELLRSGAAAALVEAVSGIAAVRACIEAGSMATPRVETVGRGMLPPRGRAKRVIADSR